MAQCLSPECMKKKSYVNGVCRVHELVDNDTVVRPVWWCKTCKAYLCADCMGNMPKRTLAFGMNLVEAVKNFVSGTSSESEEVSNAEGKKEQSDELPEPVIKKKRASRKKKNAK